MTAHRDTFDPLIASELTGLFRDPIVTKSGWLTRTAFEAGMEEVFFRRQKSWRRQESEYEPGDRVVLNITPDGDYLVTVEIGGIRDYCRTDRLNWARKVFAAYVNAFTTELPGDFIDASLLLKSTKEFA